MGLTHTYSDNSGFIRLEGDDVIIDRDIVVFIDKAVTLEVTL